MQGLNSYVTPRRLGFSFFFPQGPPCVMYRILDPLLPQQFLLTCPPFLCLQGLIWAEDRGGKTNYDHQVFAKHLLSRTSGAPCASLQLQSQQLCYFHLWHYLLIVCFPHNSLSPTSRVRTILFPILLLRTSLHLWYTRKTSNKVY